MSTIYFHTDTALSVGLRALFVQLEQQLQLARPLKVYLAGGMAVHLYTANRVTTDVDAEFAGRVMLPHDLFVEITLEDGTPQVIYLDTNYNATFALLHEDYQDDALAIDFSLQQLQIFVLAPVDLAVSKISRLAETDKQDIYALVRHGLTDAAKIEQRALAALPGYIGAQNMLLSNLRMALDIASRAGANLAI